MVMGQKVNLQAREDKMARRRQRREYAEDTNNNGVSATLRRITREMSITNQKTKQHGHQTGEKYEERHQEGMAMT